MSAIPADARDLPMDRPQLALAGRPNTWALGADFRFLCRVGRSLGIYRLKLAFAPALLGQVSEKMVSACRRTPLEEQRLQNQAWFRLPVCGRIRNQQHTIGCTTTSDGQDIAVRTAKSSPLDDGRVTRHGNAQRMRRLYFVRTNFDQRARQLSQG